MAVPEKWNGGGYIPGTTTYNVTTRERIGVQRILCCTKSAHNDTHTTTLNLYAPPPRLGYVSRVVKLARSRGRT